MKNIPILALTTLLTAANSEAAVQAFYQFEDTPGFQADSSGNSRTLTNSGATQVVNPGFGNNTGSESANFLGSSGSQGLSTSDFLSNSDFTVEYFFRLDALNSSDNFFVTQYNTTGNDRGFRIETNGSNLSLRLGYSGGSNEEQVFTFAPVVNTNYYNALSIDLGVSSTSATLYSQDVTNGGTLQSQTVTFSNVTSSNFNNSSADFIIGNSANNANTNALFEGTIDSVRVSDSALSQGQLLIPEPSSAVLLLGGSLGLFLRRRRK